MTGFVPYVALPDRCLWSGVADTKSREFVVNSFAKKKGMIRGRKASQLIVLNAAIRYCAEIL
jgi:hypothetical protein